MRSRKNYADWSYQARTNRVKIVGCPNAENRWPDWTVFLFSAFLCWFVWRYVVSIHAPTRGATALNILIRDRDQFQSTLPRGERPSTHTRMPLKPVFQSTLPRGERPRSSARLGSSRCFNPRSHEGSDPINRHSRSTLFLFQSTLPRGERRHHTKRATRRIVFQSTLPRGERRAEPEAVRVVPGVSIHAPTRGATNLTLQPCYIVKVSIHAPTRGATFAKFGGFTKVVFQSTLPRGERPIQCSAFCVSDCFNPRSHEGSDGGRFALLGEERGFNPRSHEGSDCSCPPLSSHRQGFNPRSHEGSDFSRQVSQALTVRFQSTLPRGERHNAQH